MIQSENSKAFSQFRILNPSLKSVLKILMVNSISSTPRPNSLVRADQALNAFRLHGERRLAQTLCSNLYDGSPIDRASTQTGMTQEFMRLLEQKGTILGAFESILGAKFNDSKFDHATLWTRALIDFAGAGLTRSLASIESAFHTPGSELPLTRYATDLVQAGISGHLQGIRKLDDLFKHFLQEKDDPRTRTPEAEPGTGGDGAGSGTDDGDGGSTGGGGGGGPSAGYHS
jgi:uncharacterized membrane protein YgcG